MEGERRQQPRLSVYLECTWMGASGFSTSRVIDLSVGGCYVDTRKVPPGVGQPITITLPLDLGDPLLLPGTIVNVHTGMGFGVQFTHPDRHTEERLKALLQRIGEDHPSSSGNPER